MSKLYVFNDNSDDVKQVEKSSLSKPVSDSILSDSAFGEAFKNFRVYNIATVSDKVINRRIYPDEYIRKTVQDFRWLTPYFKPMLINHDTSVEPLGRVVDSFYYNHSSQILDGGTNNEKVPQKVLDSFAGAGLFEDGTGSVILEMKATDVAVSKIRDGIYLTTSQSSATDGFTCSICGKDIYDCEHMPGEVYDNNTCYAMTQDLYPIENSVVNQPANKTSVLVLYDKEHDVIEFFNGNGKLTDMNSTKDSETDIISPVTDNKEVENKTFEKGVSMDQEKLMKLADGLKKMCISNLLDKLGVENNAEVEEKFNEVFDAINIDELGSINELTRLIVSQFGSTLSDKDAEINSLNDKVAELEATLVVKDEEIAELQKVEDTVIEEEVTPEPEVKDDKEVVEPVVEEDKEPVVTEEIKDEVKPQVEEVVEDEVKDTVVPDFLEDNNKKDDLFGTDGIGQLW